jgi:hypothetical protein
MLQQAPETYMRRIALALALSLAACGQQQAQAPPVEEVTVRVPPPWFICDAVNFPGVFVFDRSNADVRVAEYDKPNGALVQRQSYLAADEEGAAGSIYIALAREDGAEGSIRQINPGMLETPGSAYTLPFTSVQLDGHNIDCRWMPRTRVLGFTGRRSFVVYEDASGDLIYTAYDFTDAARAHPIELSENGRSTSPFSLEVRDGTEEQTPQALRYAFQTQGYRYVVTLNRDGTGALDIALNGAMLQSEPLTAYQQGTAPAQ